MKRLPLLLLVAAWIVAISRLFITDVWDESIALPLYLNGVPYPFYEIITRKIPVFCTRPLPVLLQAAVACLTTDHRVLLALLRGMNASLLIASLWFLLAVIRQRNASKPWHEFVLAVAILFSASGLIVAGWAANSFDAVCLFCLSAGLYLLLARGFALAAGVLFGLSLLAKETGVLVWPFLALLCWQGKIPFRSLIRVAVAAAPLVLVFAIVRGLTAPPGSEKDIHGFAMANLLPSLTGWLESFWRQNLMRDRQTILGWAWIVVSLAFIRDRKTLAAALTILVAAGLLYWGMTAGHQGGRVMSPANFIPRLYLIPAFLLLAMMALQNRFVLIAVLLVPILAGGAGTFRNHMRLQRAYAEVQRRAAEASLPRPFLAGDSSPSMPLVDSRRNIVYGRFKNADVLIDARTGGVQSPPKHP